MEKKQIVMDVLFEMVIMLLVAITLNGIFALSVLSAKKVMDYKDKKQYPIECTWYSDTSDETINGICGSNNEFIQYKY